MAFLIGMDEAGYGPNLGPLVISATVWRVPDAVELASIDLYEWLSAVIAPSPAARQRDDPRFAIADSKLLYKPRQSMRPLESGLLACLRQLHPPPEDWLSGWSLLTEEAGAHRDDAPWYADYNRPLPLEATAEQIEGHAERLQLELQLSAVELVALRSVAIFPSSFNSMCAKFGSKGTLLTDQSIRLLAKLTKPLTGDCLVICDKHGGRNRYGSVLQHYFSAEQLAIEAEATAESSYRLRQPERSMRVCFRAKGEGFLPAALASMASKYLRELAMMAFNDYWLAVVPGLRPTAGYPTDAKRFRAEIAAAQHSRGISDEQLWRAR